MNEVSQELVAAYIGVPFKWGGRNKQEGLDCVGIVLEFLYEAGFRYTDNGVVYDRGWWRDDPQRFIREILARGEVVETIADLRPFDVLCFQVGGVVRHIGVYLGYGKFLHSFKDASGIGRLDEAWKKRFVAAARPSHATGL